MLRVPLTVCLSIVGAYFSLSFFLQNQMQIVTMVTVAGKRSLSLYTFLFYIHEMFPLASVSFV